MSNSTIKANDRVFVYDGEDSGYGIVLRTFVREIKLPWYPEPTDMVEVRFSGTRAYDGAPTQLDVPFPISAVRLARDS
jgi:hypothetical protein